MFFILIVRLNGIQIIALVCMISGLQFGIIFGSRIYVKKLRKILTIEIFISECLEAEKFSLAVKSNHD
jgi:hypothetical protein